MKSKILVIPTIDLHGGCCVRLENGAFEKERVYFEDPVKMARLWRIQNAKVIHLVDHDAGAVQGTENSAVIGEICQQLDIPVQLSGGILTMENIDATLETGVYRVVLDAQCALNPDLISEAVSKYGCSKVVVRVNVCGSELVIPGMAEATTMDAAQFVLDMESRGCRRFVYSSVSFQGVIEAVDHQACRDIGSRLSRARLTLEGGIRNQEQLRSLNELSGYRVDSVILGRSLYENAFSCQKFWCWNAIDELDLTHYSTASLKQEATSSDSTPLKGHSS